MSISKGRRQKSVWSQRPVLPRSCVRCCRGERSTVLAGISQSMEHRLAQQNGTLRILTMTVDAQHSGMGGKTSQIQNQIKPNSSSTKSSCSQSLLVVYGKKFCVLSKPLFCYLASILSTILILTLYVSLGWWCECGNAKKKGKRIVPP